MSWSAPFSFRTLPTSTKRPLTQLNPNIYKKKPGAPGFFYLKELGIYFTKHIENSHCKKPVSNPYFKKRNRFICNDFKLKNEYIAKRKQYVGSVWQKMQCIEK